MCYLRSDEKSHPDLTRLLLSFEIVYRAFFYQRARYKQRLLGDYGGSRLEDREPFLLRSCRSEKRSIEHTWKVGIMRSGFCEEFARQFRNVVAHAGKASSLVENQIDAVEQVCGVIESARSIHVYGKGRSGAVAVCLALRLKHFGYDTWFVGDIVKEGIKAHDVAVLFSGSGETSDVVDVAERARAVGAKVVSVTSFRDSALGRLSDITVVLPGGLEKGKGWDYLKAQLGQMREDEFYGAGEFELYAFLFQEAFLNALGSWKKISQSAVLERHEDDAIIHRASPQGQGSR